MVATETRLFTLQPADQTRRFWAYATAFGAAWGVFEVTVGTFVHTLRLPLAGPVLACVGAALLVAQRQLLPVRGITLATGLVAAACKSISPGGIILGPMIGIAGEALLLELVLLMAPRAWISAALAGAVAALLPVCQKIVMQLVFYGGTVIELYVEALTRLANALGITGSDAVVVGAIALAALSAMGAITALIGKVVGGRVARQLETGTVARLERPIVGASASFHGPHPSGGRARRPPGWLPAPLVARRDHLIALAALVAVGLQLEGAALFSLTGVALLLATLGLLRPEALARMWRPRFWLFTLALACASGLLLGPRDVAVAGTDAAVLSSVGLLAGLVMVLRGALVFALTSWAAVAVDGSRLLPLTRRLGIAQLGEAIGSAMSLMPQVRVLLQSDEPSPERPRGVRPAQLLTRGVAVAAQLAERAAGRDPGRRATTPVAAVIGTRGAGKSSTIAKLSAALAARGVAASGLCQPAHPDRNGYDLLALPAGERHPFARRRVVNGERGGGLGFEFDPSGWDWARCYLEAAMESAQVVVVDEMGRLEARGEGHVAILSQLGLGREVSPAKAAPRLLLLGVQEAVAAEVESQVGGFDFNLHLPCSDAGLDRFLEELVDVAVEGAVPESFAGTREVAASSSALGA